MSDKNNTSEDRIAELEALLAIQTAEGNWNHSPYMHGMANGIIFSLSVLTDKDPKFLDPPDMFHCDTEMFDKFNNSSIIVHNKSKKG